MKRAEVLRQIDNLNVWKRGSQRAPHKPLLLLLALGRLQSGEGRLIPYEEIDQALGRLLLEFGPPRKSVHPEYPFWRLQWDGLWEVAGGGFAVREGNTDPKKSSLLANDAKGGFPARIFKSLSEHPDLVAEVARNLLDGHFPPSIHEEILNAVGLSLEREAVRRTRRDSRFRDMVLDAYERRCSVCGFDVQLGNRTIGLDAAHIKWVAAGGPDRLGNGLALCSLHHRTFDLGAFTVGDQNRLEVSEKARGGTGFDQWLMRFHGKPLRRPVNRDYSPATRFVGWHRREVFKGPSRPMA